MMYVQYLNRVIRLHEVIARRLPTSAFFPVGLGLRLGLGPTQRRLRDFYLGSTGKPAGLTVIQGDAVLAHIVKLKLKVGTS